MSYTDLIDDVVRGWSRDFRHRKSGIRITKDIFDIWRVGILKDIAQKNVVYINDAFEFKGDLINLFRLKYKLWLEFDSEKVVLFREFPTRFKLVETVNSHNHWYTPKQFDKGTVMYYSGSGGYGSCNWLKGIPLWEDMTIIEGTSIIPSLQINYEFIEVLNS